METNVSLLQADDNCIVLYSICAAVLDSAGNLVMEAILDILEQKLLTTPEATKQIFQKIPRSHRHGDRDAFALAKPAAHGAGTR